MDLTGSVKTTSLNASISNASTKRTCFLATYQHHQKWSLPDSIIYYITKNPSSSKAYEKMIQSCKYFFMKNPILIVSNLYFRFTKWCTWLDVNLIDIQNVSSKIWVTGYFNVRPIDKTSNVSFNNIYQCDAKDVVFWNQIVSFNNLKLLTTKCESLYLNHVIVISENDTVVALENIVEAVPYVKRFQFGHKNDSSKAITSKTATELIKNTHFSNIERLDLYDVPESFNIDCFYEYIKKNKKTKIWLDFCADISPAYRSRLQSIVNEIIATQNRDYAVPFIQFYENDEPTADELIKLYGTS